MGNELDNIKVDVKVDGNKAITQTGIFLERVPGLGNLIAKQKYRNKIIEALGSQHVKLIEENKATIDDNGKFIIFDELKENPIQQSKAISDALVQRNESNITGFILEDLRDKKTEDFAKRENTQYSDEEFMPHWQDGFRQMNREDLQRLWAKIFVQEMQHPNSVSLRTMAFVKTLSKRDAQIFRKILPYVMSNGVLPQMYNIIHNMDLKHLEYLGLLLENVTQTVGRSALLSDKYALVVEKEIKFTVYALSDVGRELYAIADTSEELDFDKLEEIFDDDYEVHVGDKISFHRMTSPVQYNPLAFRSYEKKAQKDYMSDKDNNFPRLSTQPNI